MSSDCSSIPDAKFFNDIYQYPPWYSRKKMLFHNKMLKRLKKLRFLHSRSSQHYEKMSMRMSTPSIIITALSGIASFLSTSQYVDSDAQNACGITVGVLASVASVFQAYAAACQYGAKCEAHRTVAEQYNQLMVKTKFEMEMPNEEDFVDKLEAAILEVDAKCNYFVPQFIIKEWEKKDKQEKKDKEEYKKNKTKYDEKCNTGLYSEYKQQDAEFISKSINNSHSNSRIFSPNPINFSSNSKNLSPNENTHLLKKQIEAQTSNIKNSVSINVIESDLDEKLNISQAQSRDHVTININDSLEQANNNLETNIENTIGNAIENTSTDTNTPETNTPETNIENRDIEYIESLSSQNQINIDIDNTQSNI